ncbi:MAG: aminotransferase class I/II-fold pyridoxal phosphate-dependent enzyme [candidate division WOR-3 bacterium]
MDSGAILLTLGSAFAGSLGVNLLLARLAQRRGWCDWPDNRLKIHGRPVPFVGGVGVLAGLVLAAAAQPVGCRLPIRAAWIAVGLISLAAGLWDDFRWKSRTVPLTKLVVQVAVALVAGFLVTFTAALRHPLLTLAVAVVFVLGAMNALNLEDGMDGLAAGEAIISSLGIVLVAARDNDRSPFLAIGLVGALVGFLVLNWYPARIFLGDSGSHLVGAMLAVLVLGACRGRGLIALPGAVLLIGLPVLDTAWVIIRRLTRGRQVMAGARDHLYDVVHQAGVPVRTTVLVCWLVQVLLVTSGVLFLKGVTVSFPLSGVDIGRQERAAVLKVLRSGRLALGPVAAEFEMALARYVGVRHGVAVSSGTAGLHLLVRAMGLGPGDEVITTPFSFVASANCLVYEGVRPVFVDVDAETLNIDPNQVETHVTRRTKAILAVDVFGRPADWPALRAIAHRHGLRLIEDSCEALGAGIGSAGQIRRCGSFGDAAAFAFYPNKQITTGEGGMIVTNNTRIAELCRSMANQGRAGGVVLYSGSRRRGPKGPGSELRNLTSRTPGHCSSWSSVAGCWLEHVRLGYNYRMNELAAALGLAQFRRLDTILARRQRVARWYSRMLADLDQVKLPRETPGMVTSWFVYVVRLSNRYTRRDRDHLLLSLRRAGVECGDYFRPIHLQPFYQAKFGYRRGDFPVAEAAGDRTVALPFWGRMTKEDVQAVTGILKRALGVASRAQTSTRIGSWAFRERRPS